MVSVLLNFEILTFYTLSDKIGLNIESIKFE